MSDESFRTTYSKSLEENLSSSDTSSQAVFFYFNNDSNSAISFGLPPSQISDSPVISQINSQFQGHHWEFSEQPYSYQGFTVANTASIIIEDDDEQEEEEEESDDQQSQQQQPVVMFVPTNVLEHILPAYGTKQYFDQLLLQPLPFYVDFFTFLGIKYSVEYSITAGVDINGTQTFFLGGDQYQEATLIVQLFDYFLNYYQDNFKTYHNLLNHIGSISRAQQIFGENFLSFLYKRSKDPFVYSTQELRFKYETWELHFAQRLLKHSETWVKYLCEEINIVPELFKL